MDVNQAGSLVRATVLGVLSREALGCSASRGLYKYVAKRSLSTLRGFKLALESKKNCGRFMGVWFIRPSSALSWPCRGEKRKTAMILEKLPVASSLMKQAARQSQVWHPVHADKGREARSLARKLLDKMQNVERWNLVTSTSQLAGA